MRSGEIIEQLPPPALRDAIAALWRIRAPGPRNLFKTKEFANLREVCAKLYPKGTANDFALNYALASVGFPGRPPPADPVLALSPAVAAAQLHAQFERKQGRRVYLCPLDNADQLPELRFGPNCIRKLSASEFEDLVDQPRLKRVNSTWIFDAGRFSEFTWLVVEQTYALEKTPAERAVPFLFEIAGQDWGAIEPHLGRFPPVVEDALFAILLAPWEDWVDLGPFWRAFEMPWIYVIENDIFVHPRRPPSPETLSWEPVLDGQGEEVGEWPGRTPLTDVIEASNWLNDARWAEVVNARNSALFETPVAHFFVKAFAEEGPLDEFLAHITAIEAALLLPAERRGLTRLVKRRVSGLLGTQHEGDTYERLYNHRCLVVHGRPMAGPIPGEERLNARRLARKVVEKLVEAAPRWPSSRDEYLKSLAP